MRLAVLVAKADVTCAADDVFLTAFVHDGNQTDVMNKVDIGVVIKHLVRDVALVVKKGR